MNASAEGAGAKTVLLSDAFNVLTGHLWVATQVETFLMNAKVAAGFGYVFPATPTVNTWSCGLVYREIG